MIMFCHVVYFRLRTISPYVGLLSPRTMAPILYCFYVNEKIKKKINFCIPRNNRLPIRLEIKIFSGRKNKIGNIRIT